MIVMTLNNKYYSLQIMFMLWLFIVHPTDQRAQSNPEVAALLAFKNNLTDPNGFLSYWSIDYSSNPCDWDHIVCNSDSSVEEINLEKGWLSGQLVPELSNLKSLKHMKLMINQLRGKIPAELGNLANLETMDLQYNKLSGCIPLELGALQNLQDMFLNDNQFTCYLPWSLGALFKLKTLHLQNNQLSGPILVHSFVYLTANGVDMDFSGNPLLCTPVTDINDNDPTHCHDIL